MSLPASPVNASARGGAGEGQPRGFDHVGEAEGEGPGGAAAVIVLGLDGDAELMRLRLEIERLGQEQVAVVEPERPVGIRHQRVMQRIAVAVVGREARHDGVDQGVLRNAHGGQGNRVGRRVGERHVLVRKAQDADALELIGPVRRDDGDAPVGVVRACVGGAGDGKDRDVTAKPEQGVVTGTAVQDILSRSGDENVIARVSKQRVVVRAAIEQVVVFAALERVVAAIASESVVAEIAGKDVGATVALQGVVVVAGADVFDADQNIAA